MQPLQGEYPSLWTWYYRESLVLTDFQQDPACERRRLTTFEHDPSGLGKRQAGLNGPRVREQMAPQAREAYLEILKGADISRLAITITHPSPRAPFP